MHCMDTQDPLCTMHSAQVMPLAADDPRSPENTARRKALGIAERDHLGRLLPGSHLKDKGRKPGVMVTTLARQHTEQAIKLLGEVMQDPKAPPASRVAAATALLDRGWGKSPVQIDLNVRARFDDFLREVGAEVAREVAPDDSVE